MISDGKKRVLGGTIKKWMSKASDFLHKTKLLLVMFDRC